MKNIICIISSVCFSFTLLAQDLVEQLKPLLEEPGKCYVAYPLDTATTDAIYIEFVPAVFETISFRTDSKEFGRYFEIEEDEIVKTIEITENSVQPVLDRRPGKGCVAQIIPEYAFDDRLTVCIVDVSAKYETVKKEPSIKDNDTIYSFRPRKINLRKLVKNGTVRIISAEEAFVSTNRVVKLKGGEWSQWKEYLCPICGVRYTVAEIQESLRKFGYVISDEKDILGESTKNALVEFQKANNLQTGRLDIKTLEALGVFEDY